MGAPGTPTISWRIRDAALAWLAGLAASIVAFGLVGFEPSVVFVFGVALPAQSLVTVGALWLVSRVRGRGSLAEDFGLRARPGDTVGLLLGLVAQVLIVLLLIPVAVWLDLEEAPQELSRMISEVQTGASLLVVLASVGLLGPLAEELLFRGLLLAALRQRMGDGRAIAVSAVLFGAVHLLDPGAAIGVPVFVLLGFLLGWLVVRDGRLGRAFFTHAGVNLTGVLAAYAAAGA